VGGLLPAKELYWGGFQGQQIVTDPESQQFLREVYEVIYIRDPLVQRPVHGAVQSLTEAAVHQYLLELRGRCLLMYVYPVS